MYKLYVVGESCIDEYRYGRCDRLSPEAPVPVFDLCQTEATTGMAMNVVRNLEAFGAHVKLQSNTPDKIRKTRFIDFASGYQLLREDDESLDESCEMVSVLPHDCDAVVISDYNKGYLSDNFLRDLLRVFEGKPIFVDSKRPNLSVFENCYIKVNDREERAVESWPVSCDLVVTKGAGGAQYKDFQYPAPYVDVFDVTGAGDVFLAALTYCTLRYGNFETAVQYAVSLASRSVEHRGGYTLSKRDINEVCD